METNSMTVISRDDHTFIGFLYQSVTLEDQDLPGSAHSSVCRSWHCSVRLDHVLPEPSTTTHSVITDHLPTKTTHSDTKVETMIGLSSNLAPSSPPQDIEIHNITPPSATNVVTSL
jgi:hypothetical protein